ncbi:valine--tRNA ligase, mitochondrial 1-like isoform X1 [Zingiber officinale]|uniref:valine--tRNA ligase, mitochondrial 1-like isoform X1 n=1 Tax=Zingiber officinale TaxID=94328 RepID=UPI001C4B5C74|nr:valine--tRNA ligase, mitochondrial 1-like isoform X1 [Zingiber officinale]
MAPPMDDKLENPNKVDKIDDQDLERKIKKEQKAKLKEEKKLKAAQKAEAAKLQAQKPTDDPKKSDRRQRRRDVDEERTEDFIDPATPDGQKKQLSRQMAKQYNPSVVEKSWYSWWEASGFFVADANCSKPPFVIVLPPPNVTGALHIGHGLTAAIQDTIIRWRRMSGYNVLWVPGMDHAGIATQVVVEKKLMRESKLTRHDIGREKFVSEVWKWKNDYGGQILNQERRLGASLDWSRECFTMDDARSKAVTEAFVRLYKKGLLYRDHRLVNWDCTLRTAISDIEVDHEEITEETYRKVPGYEHEVQFGVLTSFAYALEGGMGEIVVATTRVETMLGDTAIAVHSKDKRYAHLHGKCAVHPFNERKLPIICDDILVDPEFGTGAVKITPAHDPNDFEVGKRHNLAFVNIFTDEGKINSNGGADFEGLPRFAARVAVVEALKAKGLYRGAQKNEMKLGICSRSNDVVEPMIKPQWFVDCKSMAKLALDAVMSDDKKIEIIPHQYEQEWKRWLENIRDWCISRQLWWGHRIPAWYVTIEDDQLKDVGSYNDHWVVGRNEQEAIIEAKKIFSGKKFEIAQDPDVLDTWFSSGLFPLSVLGWPDVTPDFKAFYPTTVLETGHDILFFWVARMVMLGMQLGGDVPFRKVYLHPMIRDAHGQKMSKSKGNVIDPLEVTNGVSLEGLHKRLEASNLDRSELEKAKLDQAKDFPNGIPECGADALRFALVSYTAQSDKINLDVLRVIGYRQWCNKLWNAIRFAMMKLGDDYAPPEKLDVKFMPPVCQWILSVLNNAIAKTISSFELYKFSDATTAVYAWWQFQLCDVFIEAIKPYFIDSKFESARADARHTLWICLDTGLRLLHPLMPFVTEELWQRLPQIEGSCRKESIMISDYPSVIEAWSNEKIENDMEIVNATVRKLRSLRPQSDRSERYPAFAICRQHDIANTMRTYEFEILTLATVSSLKVLTENDMAPAGCAVDVVNESLSVYLQLQGTLDAEAEREKLRKRREEIQKKHDLLAQEVNNAGYKEKAPLSIQEEQMRKLNAYLEELKIIDEAEQDLETRICEQK